MTIKKYIINPIGVKNEISNGKQEKQTADETNRR